MATAYKGISLQAYEAPQPDCMGTAKDILSNISRNIVEVGFLARALETMQGGKPSTALESAAIGLAVNVFAEPIKRIAITCLKLNDSNGHNKLDLLKVRDPFAFGLVLASSNNTGSLAFLSGTELFAHLIPKPVKNAHLINDVLPFQGQIRRLGDYFYNASNGSGCKPSTTDEGHSPDQVDMETGSNDQAQSETQQQNHFIRPIARFVYFFLANLVTHGIGESPLAADLGANSTSYERSPEQSREDIIQICLFSTMTLMFLAELGESCYYNKNKPNAN